MGLPEWDDQTSLVTPNSQSLFSSIQPFFGVTSFSAQSIILMIPRLLPFLLLTRFAFSLEIGNDPNGGGSVDGWASTMVIDESSTYTNTSGADEVVTPVGFDFQVGNNRGRVTPFLVKVHSNNNFTVVAIGRTRVSGTDYSSTGVFEFDFDEVPDPITLANGETLAAGMTNANPDGSGNGGSVIPFAGSSHDAWFTGGSGSTQTGSISLNAPPTPGPSSLNLGRTYAFSIDVDIGPAFNAPPTDLVLSGGNPLPGLPSGSTLGSFSTVDPTIIESHTYTLVTNPGSRYAIEDDLLKTAGPVGAPGSTDTIRVRTEDLAGNTLEKDFNLTVETQFPPTDILLDATSLNAFIAPGSPVSGILSTDPNAADQFVYELVAGPGDDYNNLFSINGNTLFLFNPVPEALDVGTLRLRTTDLGGNSFERSFVLPIQAPEIRLNEFVASNSILLDEDGDTPDWIELLNTGTSEVNLANWTLSDNPDRPSKWIFPAIALGPGEYLVIFASGKNRRDPLSELHTNFSLSTNGETLSLYAPGGVNLVDQFLSPPDQYPNIAYGLDFTHANAGYLNPSPGAANGISYERASDEVTFSHLRGSYPSPFSLTLTAPAGTQIRYTTNGSAPTASSALYSAPISVSPPTSGSTSGIRTIRAAVFGGGSLIQPVATHTYFFVAQAVNQSDLRSSITNDPAYSSLIDDALLAHPIISLTRPAGLPGGSESITSLEFFDPSNPTDHFQVDCGIKVVGGHSVGSPKNNFRLYFRSIYGQSKLNHPLFDDHPYTTGASSSFDRLNLRSGSHDSFFWLANPSNPGNSGGPVKGDAQYLRNRWICDMQLSMGHPAPRGRWIQVFINGNYRGQYHLLEHPNQDFHASYLGGEKEDYEFTNAANSSKTGSDNWQAVWSQVKAAASSGDTEAQRWVDYENLADYMILNFYCGNPWDWNPNQNWMTGGPNQPDQGGWKFYSWDSDIIFQDPGANVLGKNVPDGLFRTLITKPDFATVFRDRLYHHCFHDGILTPTQIQTIYDARAQEINVSIITETARWQGSAANPPWDRDDEWLTELNRMRNTYFPVRHNNLMNQVRARGWYPVEAPEFAQRGGSVPPGYQPSITADEGTIYITTDGSDPRLPGGAVSPQATPFNPGLLTLTAPAQIRARAFHNSDWSALNEAAFVIEGTVPADITNLALTELHYHPSDSTAAEIAAGYADDNDFEFLEFTNTSASTIDLTGVSIVHGVSFTFPPAFTLSPGERTLVVRNPDAFLFRNPGLESFIAGRFESFTGNPDDEILSNGGERLTVLDANLLPIVDLTYNDKLPWPNESDGDGFSLVLRNHDSAADDPASWRSSRDHHGNPASTDTTAFPPGGDPLAYALADPNLSLRFTRTGKMEVTYLANLTADDATIILQESSDLSSWTTISDYELDDRDNYADGTIKTTIQSPVAVTDPTKFYRLRVIVP